MRLQGDVLFEVKAAKVKLEGIAALVIGEWLNLRCLLRFKPVKV